MLTTNFSARFKKDLKLMEKRGRDMQKIYNVTSALQNNIPLAPQLKEHPLKGNYKGCLECHIEPDWLLIYHIDPLTNELYFIRTGTHADLLD